MSVIAFRQPTPVACMLGYLVYLYSIYALFMHGRAIL